MAKDKPEDRELKRMLWTPNFSENKCCIPSLRCFTIYRSHQPVDANKVILILIPKIQGYSPSCSYRNFASSSQVLWTISGSHGAQGILTWARTNLLKLACPGLLAKVPLPPTASGAGDTLENLLCCFLLPCLPPLGLCDLLCSLAVQMQCGARGENSPISKPVSRPSREFNSSYFSP